MAAWRQLPRSVKIRFRILLVTVFGVGALLALFAGWGFARSASDEAYDRLLQSAAVQFFDGASTADGQVTILPPESAFDTLSIAEADRFFYAVRAPSGRLLTGYPDLPAAGPADSRLAMGNSRYLGETVRVLTLRRPVRTAKSEGFLSVSVAQTRIARDAMQLKLFERSAPVTLAIAALGLLASLFAAGYAVRPLARLESALEARKPQDLTPLRIDGPRETEALVFAINALVLRIGHRVEKLELFAGLAAHQLRTPLAALGSQVDLLANEADDEKGRKLRIARLSVRLKELNRLIHQLLGHAMIVYRGDTVPTEVVDLSALARSVAQDVLAGVVGKPRLRVHIDEAELRIVGDEVMLREAITNLVANAVVHGAVKLIRIGLRSEANFAILSVADDGPGIAPVDWNSAPEPFSMKRQNETGAGLGLSIARQTAISHGGDLFFGHNEDGLFTVSLRLATDGGAVT